jgi:hypothetical protein|tara:strand:- start:104 stop:1300 length:1197 start_codon:yes stop_codon:yes gene_type:complete
MIKVKFVILLSILVLLPLDSKAEDYNVYYAGFSFSGNYSDVQAAGKYTNKILQIKNENGLDVVSASLLDSIKNITPPNYKIKLDMADLSQGSKDAIVMSVALDQESYSYEYDPIAKSYLNNIDMYFQIMFYNFDSKKLIAAIPFDVEINVRSKKEFSEKEIIALIRKYYSEGLSGSGTKQNAFYTMEKILNKFILKDKYNFRIGVTSVSVEDKALAKIPEALSSNLSALKNIFAQSLSSRLSMHQSIALVPFMEGMAIGGQMKQRFVNTDEIYNIEVPKPDFNIELTIRGFKKVLVKTSDVNNLFLYGAYINVKVLQPDLEKVYIDTKLKNANQLKIPTSIKNIDDWRKFNASLARLFDQFAVNIVKPTDKYLKLQSKKPNTLKDKLGDLSQVLDKVK